MKVNNQLPLQRLIAKIDNDFNIDNSDWIPRVAAWVTDALSQIKVLPMQCTTRELEVVDRIAQHPCMGNVKKIEVFDSYGNEIKSLDSCTGNGGQCGNLLNGSPSTGGVIGVFTGSKDVRDRVQVASIINPIKHNYVISNVNQIELNFDTDKIKVKTEEVATYFDDYFNCEVPYIYDNGTLLEALAWYCLFKMLSRGYKHQVFSISSQVQHLNPYTQWIFYKNRARISVLHDINRYGAKNGWANFFFNSTFRPRD